MTISANQSYLNVPEENAYREQFEVNSVPSPDSSDSFQTLYFAPHQIWPLTSGARLRDYHLARHLSARCSVTFAEMRWADEQPSKPPGDSGFAKVVTLEKGRTYGPLKILRGLAGPVPVTVLNCWSRRMGAVLTRALGTHRFATVQMESVHLMQYLPSIQSFPGSPTVVLDWHNIESELMWRYASNGANFFKKHAAARTAKLLEHAEDRLLDCVAGHTVTSDRERRKLLARRPDANIQVVPNGVDSAHFSPQECQASADRARRNGSKPNLLFVGSMDYHANSDAVIWFSQKIWPEIAREHANIQFVIVGRCPNPQVRALASDRVEVTGTVDDVRPYYASAIAAVVPLRTGSGTRLKILESMAAGVPVVSTTLGAEGIDAQDGVNILLANSEREIAAAISKLIRSAETRNRIAAVGRELVKNSYDWCAIGDRLYRIHSNLAQERLKNPRARPA
jgi:sugar transferase (PEP-CTERM/EpsH1 system associated)